MRAIGFSGAIGALLRHGRAAPDQAAFLLLYRLRRAAFRRQSAALYRRYGHTITIFMTLFGLLIVERPALLAAPLLHFRDAPGQPVSNLAYAALWMGLVAAWAGVHRAFVRGGALASYCRSLPLDPRTPALVDLGMLGFSLQVLLLPFGVAIWMALRSGDPGGADGRFWLYLALLAALAVSTAKTISFGRTRSATLAQAGAVATLVFAGQLPPGLPSALAVMAVLLACLREALAPRAHSAPDAYRGASRPRSASLLPSVLPPVLRLQAGLLVHRQRQATVVRLLWAALPLVAAWWLIVYGNKSPAEAHAFVQLACALTAWLTSGLFYTFHTEGESLQPFLRSIAFGAWRMLLAGHVLVLGVTAILFAALPLALAGSLGLHHPAVTSALQAGAWWLAWLVLLGLPVIQRHNNGILFKLALVIAALLIVFNL